MILKLLEGHVDTIGPAAEEQDKFYASQICPYCQGDSTQKHADGRLTFSGESALPKFLLKCDSCGCIFDPHTGLIAALGNLAEALEPAIPLINGDGD